MIKLKHKPVNRAQRKIFNSEVKALSKIFDGIEAEFYQDVFTSGDDEPYEEIYDHYSEVFRQACRRAKGVIDPFFFLIEEDYFERNFKPVERFNSSVQKLQHHGNN